MSEGQIAIYPLAGLPEITPGAQLGPMIAALAGGASDGPVTAYTATSGGDVDRIVSGDPGTELQGGEVIAISQKVVSKAEGRIVELAAVSPGQEARRLAERCDKDPRLVELVLGESRSVIRVAPGVLITETRHGLICANAGIDSSNLSDEATVALLPEDPDRSAREIRASVQTAVRAPGPRRPPDVSGGGPAGDSHHGPSGEPGQGPLVAVVITDSFGRPWRLGQTEVAIGCAGLAPLDDWRGRHDSSGRELTATAIAIGDQIAAAADLARTKISRTPVVILRGLERHVTEADGPGAGALRRPESEDLFRT